MASSMQACARKHHKRSTSSTTIPPLHNGSPAAAAVLENSKWMCQNRRSTSARKVAADTPEEESGLISQEMGLLLLSAAQNLHVSGENPVKARRYALKAVEYLEKTGGQGNTVVSLHLLASTLCELGQYEEAIQVLEKSITVSLSDPELAPTTFSGFMQLGNTYFMTGQHDAAMASYESGLQVQKQVLGDSDLQVADTCRYVAEAYLQLMLFNKAEDLCSQALNIQSKSRRNGGGSNEEEVSTRRVMALIHSAKGENDAALEQLLLASASLSSSSSSSNIDVPYLDVSIGDTYLALGRFNEAVLSYDKALAVFKLVHGEWHTTVASIYISLADLYLRKGVFKEAKLHCEKALLIYGGKCGGGYMAFVEEIAVGLAGVAGLFESMGELKHAISLLHSAHEILGSSSEQHGMTMITGEVEAQMGVLLRMSGNHEEAYVMLRRAISKFRSVTQEEGGSVVVGMLLNQLGLACVGLNAICEAAQSFEESRSIFQRLFGVHHSETLDVCVNLAGAYDAMGRVGDAIDMLENVVEVKENRLGTAHPDVEYARQWLGEMLKETGRIRSRKTHTLHHLLRLPKQEGDGANVVEKSHSPKIVR